MITSSPLTRPLSYWAAPSAMTSQRLWDPQVNIVAKVGKSALASYRSKPGFRPTRETMVVCESLDHQPHW